MLADSSKNSFQDEGIPHLILPYIGPLQSSFCNGFLVIGAAMQLIGMLDSPYVRRAEMASPETSRTLDVLAMLSHHANSPSAAIAKTSRVAIALSCPPCWWRRAPKSSNTQRQSGPNPGAGSTPYRRARPRRTGRHLIRINTSEFCGRISGADEQTGSKLRVSSTLPARQVRPCCTR